MFDFIPKEPKAVKVPYFEDASRDEGWQGYSTTKNIKRLQSEIAEAIQRLGGVVSGFQRGTFMIDNQKREGFRIHYSIQDVHGYIPGRVDIAALPVRHWGDEARVDKSLRMALYMLRVALDGMWFMQQLSPGYAPLMPWMIVQGDKTVTQLWAENSIMSNLLPPPESDFIEGEVVG